MKRILLSALTIYILLSSTYLSAENQFSTENAFPRIPWASRGPNDIVTIENGTGLQITVTIYVNNSGTRVPAIINMKNCGTTTRVKAGSAVICWTSDSANPVNFSTDNSEYPASGTYQIRPLQLQ